MIIEFHCPLFDGRICYIMLFGFLQRTFVPCINVGCMTLQALVWTILCRGHQVAPHRPSRKISQISKHTQSTATLKKARHGNIKLWAFNQGKRPVWHLGGERNIGPEHSKFWSNFHAGPTRKNTLGETPRWWKTVSQSPFTEVWKRKRLDFLQRVWWFDVAIVQTLDKISKNICCLAAWSFAGWKGSEKGGWEAPSLRVEKPGHVKNF